MKIFKCTLIASSVLVLSGGLYIVLSWMESGIIKTILWGVILVLGLLNLGYYIYFRKRFVQFSTELCHCTGQILKGKKMSQLHNQESLTSKMVMELEKIEDNFQYRLAECETEKKNVQKIVSEITHQLKTPLSNIRMYNDMLSEQENNDVEIKNFIHIIQQQLVKLEFLMDALIKSSRLENEMIQLNLENHNIVQTLAIAVNNVIQKAESRKISISVDCRPSIQVHHDAKWTAEAIENILDNAIKYTPDMGKVSICVITGEMYTEIKIEDTGKGIDASHINDIFKRFYRETSVLKSEGVGLGLYLAQKIISLQGGYILVHSAVGAGSCFSVFLPNHISA